MKAIDHPEPSGDREIARGLFEYFQTVGAEVFVYSDFRLKEVWRKPLLAVRILLSMPIIYFRLSLFKPNCFFTYHSYYKVPDVLGSVYSKLFSKPYFIFEGMYSERPKLDPRWKVGHALNLWALRASSHVFTDKSDDLAGLQKIWPREIWSERFTLIPPSLSIKEFNVRRMDEGAARLRVICVAMLRPDRKTEGVLFLLQAVKSLFEQGMDFDLQIVGGGACLSQVRDQAMEIDHRIQVLGQKNKSEIAELLTAADVFAFPGIDEGFGLVYLEAQASGLPVVAFDNGGIADAVEKDQTGFLTPLRDLPAYQLALKTLLENSGLRKEMGLKGRARVEREFDRDQNYGKIYEHLKAKSLAGNRSASVDSDS